MSKEKGHLHIPIDRALHNRILMAMPHGTRSALFKSVLEIVVDAIEKEGAIMIGAILTNRIKLRYIPEEEPASETGAPAEGPTKNDK